MNTSSIISQCFQKDFDVIFWDQIYSRKSRKLIHCKLQAGARCLFSGVLQLAQQHQQGLNTFAWGVCCLQTCVCFSECKTILNNWIIFILVQRADVSSPHGKPWRDCNMFKWLTGLVSTTIAQLPRCFHRRPPKCRLQGLPALQHPFPAQWPVWQSGSQKQPWSKAVPAKQRASEWNADLLVLRSLASAVPCALAACKNVSRCQEMSKLWVTRMALMECHRIIQARQSS